MDSKRDRQRDLLPVEKWTPPSKRLALQSSVGEPIRMPPPIDENTTIITAPKMILRHYQPELVQYLSIESLIPYLNQQQLLTDDENDILLNLFLSNRKRVLKLLQFIELKGDEGFQRFLKALADEPEHMGHKDLTKLLAPYRCTIPNKPTGPLPICQSIANSIALQAALQPIQGAEFDLEETIMCESVEDSECSGAIVELEPSSRESNEESGSTGSFTSKPQDSSNTVSSAGPAGHYETSSAHHTNHDRHSTSAGSSDEAFENSDITGVEEIKELLENDEAEEPSNRVVRKYPNLIFPSGPLQKKSSSLIYTSLFQLAWSGNEGKARYFMRCLRRSNEVSTDIKIVSMEVVHTVNADRDLKILTSALAYTDRPSCENKSILKCRLHRRIAGLHYRNNDLEEANEHMDTALQLAHNIGPDIDTIYTHRLKALMLFEDYKKTKSKDSYRDANKFFTRAMDHARLQPESKRVITERVKVSKALFHLDMWEEYRKEEKERETLTELEYRAQDTLEDVDEEYLTDGDKAFLYMTRARLFVCGEDWQAARAEAQRALELNQRCGLDKRAKEAQELMAQIPTTSRTDT